LAQNLTACDREQELELLSGVVQALGEAIDER
jgi:hypothetical protein